MSESIVIVSAARTPIAGLLGEFSSLAAWELGAVAIRAAVERAEGTPDLTPDQVVGHLLQLGPRHPLKVGRASN